MNGRERRRWERLETAVETWLTVEAAEASFRCRLEDVSLGGVRLWVPAQFPDAEAVTLDHPMAGRLTGRRAWRRADRMGIAFAAPQGTLEHALRCVSLLLQCPDGPVHPTVVVPAPRAAPPPDAVNPIVSLRS